MGNDRGPLQMLINDKDMSFYEDSNEDREINMHRSGSCPPTIERMNRYDNGFLNEDELRSDPNYPAYYYSNASKNPRFPHPVMSKEDWRFNQRIKAVGSGVIRSNNDGINERLGLIKEENEKAEWLDKERDGLIGFSIGREKSFADIFQDELNHSNLYMHPPSCLSSSNAFDGTGSADSNIHMGGKNQAIGTSHNSSTLSYQSFASVLSSSLSRSNTPDSQLIARAPSPSLPPIGSNKKINHGNNSNVSNNGSSSFNTQSRCLSEQDSLEASLSGLSLSNARSNDEDIIAQAMLQKEMEEQHNFLFGTQNGNHINFSSQPPRNSFAKLERNQMGRQNLFVSPNGSPAHYQHFTNTNGAFTSEMSGYPTKTSSPSMLPNYNVAMGNYTEVTDPLLDPLYAQYLRSMEYIANNSSEIGHANISYDILETQKQYLDALLQSEKQYALPYLGKASGLNQEYYPNSACGLGRTFPGSPVLPVSPGRPGSPLWLGEHSMRFASSGMRNLAGGIMSMSNWHSDISGALNGNFGSSHLEEFKTNKTKNYELSDIIGHVVEFSADQYGSRFIQQKLETATTEEKDMVYDEIVPHAFTLITDVFGNYVIQKFFEHGSATQRRELADQLIGHVLDLSLQMYGCRVVQKAIEVVDLDQQTKMVAELDGHIIRCVHDQNGNHVIQKCIECIPETSIQFIISTFYDQVLILSTHPYGCRVIQRTLEHCHDPKTQQIMMDEVFQHLCMLAQDQYGNYVVQHVIEHGKPHERSAIIKKLAGQIVQMSQQKFASNVVEKCLIFGGPTERQILVNEMLGTTDENEPLQAMMKDQFANYVVQKVLETCDEKQREFILSRIKVHLNALKKYTYGKHIVARVEKLVAAGERRIGMQSSHAA